MMSLPPLGRNGLTMMYGCGATTSCTLNGEGSPKASMAVAHLYAQRILKDFYDSRGEVGQILRQTGRLATP